MKKNSIFTEVPLPRVKQSYFDLSHEVKMSMKFGSLTPILLLDVLPGDYITDEMVAQIRMAPMLAPVMHKINVKTDFFFVPARTLSDSWEDFITGGQNGTAEPVLAYLTPSGIDAAANENYTKKGTLWDYLGLPVFTTGPMTSEQRISALPFKAYTKIFNDYFRDPNYDQEVDIHPELDGNILNATQQQDIMTLRQRGWGRSDYFVAALPFAQRGPSVLLPIDGPAEVSYLGEAFVAKPGGGAPSSGDVQTGGDQLLRDANGDPINIQNIDEVTFTNASVTYNDFRRGLAIQKWMENNAVGGARYNEQIFMHFRTRVPDFRVQRAEYLGGGRQVMTISEVVTTAETLKSNDDPSVPVGDLGGHGISVGKSNKFSYRCQEHGFIIGIMSVVFDASYFQGIDKLWMRESRYDYAWPELAHMGEQEIQSKELFFSFDGDDSEENDEVFGYIPRYAEYKFKQDRVAGDFRDNLMFWHLGRHFVARPTASSMFQRVSEDGGGFETDYRRIFAVQNGADYLWCQLFHRIGAKRPLPYFGTPQLVG